MRLASARGRLGMRLTRHQRVGRSSHQHPHRVAGGVELARQLAHEARRVGAVDQPVQVTNMAGAGGGLGKEHALLLASRGAAVPGRGEYLKANTDEKRSSRTSSRL